MEQSTVDAINRQFNKIIYLVKKLDTRLEELNMLLKSGKMPEKKKAPVYEEKTTLLEFK
jgi:hypothetical protein